MVKPEEERSDDLEIISIGSLCSGPWDKKYWSSSRGKDRYPYPVGYKAVRTCNGIAYRMEIHEGLKGPSFSITSADGQSCSGQTPDIAWESFQKKGCPRIKLWYGKTFSCKIDGVEFFGFKNPLVQRLLRELVSNVGGTAEQCLVPFSFGKGDSRTKHSTQCKEPCSSPDRLPDCARPQIKGRRSRKHKAVNFNLTCGASLKKLRPEHQMHSNTSNSRQGTQSYLSDGTCMTYSNKENNICTGPGALAVSKYAETGQGEYNISLTKEGLPLETSHNFDHVKEEGEERKLVTGEESTSTGIDGKLSLHDQPLDRSKDAEIQRVSSSMVSESKDVDPPVPKDTQNVNDMDLCAPDSLDIMPDSTCDSEPNSLKECLTSGKCEFIATKMVISEGPSPEFYSQEEIGTSIACAEKSDLDSVGQEIDNSMMTLLLPRALPLLKTFSRKKRTMAKPSEISPSREQTQMENNGTERSVTVSSPVEVHTQSFLSDRQEKKNMHILDADCGSVVSICGQNVPVVPDSEENNQSGFDEAGLANIGRRIYRSKNLELPVNVDALDQSSIQHADSRHRKRTSDKNFIRLEVHAKGKDLNLRSNNTEGTIDDNSPGIVSCVQVPQNEISVEKGAAGSIHTSFDRFQNEATSTRNHNGTLTESIVFRSFTGGAAHDICTAKNFLLASDIQPAGYDTHQTVSSCVDTRPKRWPSSLHALNNINSSNGVVHYVAHPLTENRSLNSSSTVDDDLAFPGPSASCIDTHAPFDKKPQRNQIFVDISSSRSRLQKQGKSFCLNNREVADASSSKPQMNLWQNEKPERIVELVGCYVHPLPVSFVLLTTVENEICVCVLCGVSSDNKRTLFMYKVPFKDQKAGCPSFIGHTPLLLPTLRDAFGREIAWDRCGLQFTPDAQSLVLLKAMKAPYCREGKMQCPCSACRSDCVENNAVKVVQVKHGFVSVVVKLETINNVHCVLVCEPNYLVGVEETGRLHLWVMDSTWSSQTEECDLSTSDCIFPCIVELKRIPNCTDCIVGHNGFGEFGLWDISKRTFVARFSSPSTSVSRFLPISLFRWQSNGRDDHINDILAATKFSLSEPGELSVPIEDEDVAVWLFISTLCNSDAQIDFQSVDGKTNPVGFWRLALLVKNRVILGSALDARAAAIGASAGHGIIGTCDGLVYMWELSTGTKLRELHCFKGVGVSCIALDGSRSGPLAVAGGEQLVVYFRSKAFPTS